MPSGDGTTFRQVQGRALAAAFSALDRTGIPWLVLRNWTGLPWSNRSKDVDIGVPPARFGDAERAISEALSAEGLTRQQTAVFQWGRCSSWFGVIDGSARSVKIDLMDGFSWRVAGLFDHGRLMESARDMGDFRVPGRVEDATILLVKPLMTGGFVKPAYADLVRAALDERPDAMRAELERLFGPERAARIWPSLARGDLEALVPDARGLAWAAWRREVARAPLRHAREALRYVALEVRRRSRRPTGTFLAVLGPDGVGKTTFLDALVPALAQLQAKDPAGIELHHFRPRRFPNIASLISRRPEAPAGVAQAPHSAPPAGSASSLARMTYYWADYLWGYWTRLRRRAVGGRTILFDRYSYDFLVDPKRTRIRLPEALVRLFVATTPQPDLVIVLEAEPETIYARKQELDMAEIARQTEAYRALAARDPDRFVRLDATRPPEESVRDALVALVERLPGREIL